MPAVVAAVDPGRGLGGLALEFTPYEAPAAVFTTARLRARLGAEPGVTVTVDDAGLATLAGSASAPWVARARAVAPSVTGVRGVDDRALVDHDLGRLQDLVRDSAELALRFPVGRADLPGTDPLAAELAARVGDLALAAERAGRLVRVTLAPVRHAAEGEVANLALRRLAFTRELLGPAAGAALLFEPKLVVDGSVPIGDIGAVKLAFDVLSGPQSGAAPR